jgi:hypothetical protein
MRIRSIAVLLGSLGLVSCSSGSGGGGRTAPDASTPTPDAAILPDVGIPDAIAPDVGLPDLVIPDAVLADLTVPDLAIPDLAIPDAAFPDLSIPDFPPDLRVPDIAIPDAAVPDVAGPDLAVPDVWMPDVASPDIATPDAAPVATPDATVSGSLPRLVDPPDAGGSNQLLTCIAHLYGQTIGGVPLHPIKPVSVTNPGASPVDVIVTAQLQNYSDPDSVGLQVPAGGTASTPPLDLTLHIPDLYAISAPVTANVTLGLTLAGSTALLDAHSRNITILPKNTIFWTMPDASGKSTDSRFLIGAFVTPHDKAGAIDQLLKDAASYSRFGAMQGYQYASGIGQTKVLSVSAVPPGSCGSSTFALHAGPLSLAAQASCTACTSANSYLQIYTQSAWNSSGSPIAEVDGLGSKTGTFGVPNDDTYVFVGCNPSSNLSNRDFQITLGFTAATGAYDQMAAIYQALHARGLQYVTVSQDFFSNAQNVKFPVESLKTASANCIDGTLVFASALESMGMRPGIVMFSDHATIAVLADPSADPCTIANWLPMETTMVSSDTPMNAVTTDLTQKMPLVVQVVASECPAFTQNVPTIWDVQSLRTLGITPAAM